MQQTSKNQSNRNSITEGKNLSGKITCTQEKNYFSHKIAQIYGVQEKCEN
jgi:hypothetical protein